MFAMGKKSDGGPEANASYLGAGTEFKGTLTFEGNIRLDGNFEGEIISGGSITVGEGARVKADIVTGSALVHGQVEGNITAKERIELRSTARVIGDIKSPVLAIAEGVILEGKCIIDRNQAPGTAAGSVASSKLAELKG